MTRLLDRVDAVEVLGRLRDRGVNYREEEVDPDRWRHDVRRAPLPGEAPGPPQPGGPWETACRLAAAYEFCEPALVRAVYAEDGPLLGRDMLLEGRFWLLRFYMGVRVTDVFDEERPGGQRVWGWAYATLEGHLERGRMSYEVVKDQGTGDVELVIRAFSQGAPTLGPVTTLGWRIFGRRTQLRFYASCGRRLAAATARWTDAGVGTGVGAQPVPPRRRQGTVVLAPSDARRRWIDRFAIQRSQPG